MKSIEDPAIERVRQVRQQISQEHGHDPRRLVEHYIELQKKHQGRLLKRTEEEMPAEPANV
jgi:hypothetical protein